MIGDIGSAVTRDSEEKELQAEQAEHRLRGDNVRDPWNYYYLRYFVGAIVGACLLLIILHTVEHHGIISLNLALPTYKIFDSALALAVGVTALGTAGLAYCYIASAPVLVLHAFRGRLPPTARFWQRLSRTFAIFVLLIGSTLLVLPPRAEPCCSVGLSVLPFAVIVVLQAVFLLWPDVTTIRNFYHDLSLRRSRLGNSANPEIEEYVESYRHLREHGNAFLIILMEFVLAGALCAADTLPRFLGVIVVWILPAAFCWPLGTWLELRFPQDHG